MQATHQFLEALFGMAPEGNHTYLWTIPDKLSHWLTADDVDALAERAAQLKTNRDVYVAVALASDPGPPNRRIMADSAAGIVGLWADIDIADPDVHKKWNLPPDVDAAMSIVASAGVEPTIVVHSGHGLQVWWLFDEPWMFDSERDRGEAASLAQAWNTTLRVRAAEREWTVDSTFDLSRVMRVPGTVNRKNPSEPVDVKILDIDVDRRFSPDDFEPFLVDDSMLRQMGLSPQRSYQVSDLKLNPQAQLPFDKWEILTVNEPSFKKSWDRSRKDLQDQSPSSYDLSLATIAAQVGWTDQEIADLVICSRRKHGDDLKLRMDYYQRTIAKARDGVAREQAVFLMEEVSDELRVARQSGDHEELKEKKRSALESISQQLGIEVLRVIKYLSDPPSYRIETPTGGIDLGGSATILSWYKLRESIAGETSVVIPRFKTPAFDQLAQLIFEVCEEQETGMESTTMGQAYVWLSEYLMSRRPLDDRAEAALTEHPFVDGGVVYVFGSSLRRWLWLSRGEKVTNREMGKVLRMFGCTPVRVNVSMDGQRSTRSAWSLPPMDVEPEKKVRP